MHGGFKTLVNPGTPVNEIDVEGTRVERDAQRLRLVARQQLAERFACAQAQQARPEAR